MDDSLRLDSLDWTLRGGNSFGLSSNGTEFDPLIFTKHHNQNKRLCDNCGCESFFGASYDILAQIISVLDVTTDIIICIEFYQKDRMIFFSISLTILILALLAYDIAFILRFSREYYPAPQICLMLSLLPISPFLPFVFYFTDSRDTKLSVFIENNCCFDIEMENPSIPDDASTLRKFMEAKIIKHLGFILEALVEAFPQAILQMTAVVIYNEADIIPIISILISLLSVASKSFVFSIATALTLKQLFFNWIVSITDFYGLFFAVSWVFYPRNDHLDDAFDVIGYVYFGKLIFLVFPLIIFLSIVLHVVATYEFTKTNRPHDNIGETICRFLAGFILVTFLWICGIIASVLSLEVLNWTWLAGTLWYLGTKRYPENKTSSELYFTLIQWINGAKKHRIGGLYKGCTSYTKKQDKIMRLCAVNYIVSKNLSYNKDLRHDKYLSEHRRNGQYMNVSMSGLRNNTQDLNKSQFIRKFWDWYGVIWHGEYKYAKDLCKALDITDCDNCKRCCRQTATAWISAMVTFILGPMYFLSRFVTLLFPGWIVLYLYFWYDVNLWNTEYVDLFQMVMISIYLGLCVILSFLFYWNCSEQYLMAHILPFTNSLPTINYESRVKDTIKEITNHYYGIVVIPIRRAIVFEKFGYDLGSIVLSYLPLNDNYQGTDDNVVRVKTVV